MKFAYAVVVTLIGFVVFAITMTFAPQISATGHYAARAALLVVLGVLWLAARGDGFFARLKPVFLAYFALTAALTISYYAADPILAALHNNDSTPLGISISKAVQSTLIIASMLIIMATGGQNPASLYIRKGRLLRGLAFGLLGMALMIGLTFLPGGPGLKIASASGAVVTLAPAVALFAFSNAAMEELLFRGALLERYEALTGKWGALACTTLVFALAHVQVTYTSQLLFFLASVLVLGFLWGLLMQKSNSIWGSVLFHAGADVAVILPIYQGMIGS